jgi:hypothetical protein
MALVPQPSSRGGPCFPWIFALVVSLFATAMVLLGPGKQAALHCVQRCSRQQPETSDIVVESSSALKTSRGDHLNNSADDVIRHSRALAAAYTPLETITVFPTSFWFVKNVKVGGTTLAGVLRAVCAHYGMACLNPLKGRIGWKKEEEIREVAAAALAVGFEHVTISNHGAYIPSAARYLGKGRPLLFTTLRHPVNRVLSAYFYNLIGLHRSHTGVAEQEGEDCVAALQAGKKCKLLEGFEDHYVHGDGVFGRNHIFKYIHGEKNTATDALQQYDFVFMTERFDESLVLFMLKYGLALRDIAYLKMKDRSGTYPREEDMPKNAIEFIKERNALDLELWDLANAALDAEKASLSKEGHDVEGAMEAFAAMQAVVAAECSNYEKWYEEHGFNTMLTYWGRDNGVGSRCIMHAVKLAGF